jgi:hypothetical protein
MRSSLRRLWPVAVLCPALLTACLSNNVPSQAHPSCSWTSLPPTNAASLCDRTFTTLRRVLQASIGLDAETLRRLVAPPGIRAKIARWGEHVHTQGDASAHITPSFTLERAPSGYLGARFNMVVKTKRGAFTAPQTVYLASRSGRQVIVQDQPDQEW